MNYNFEEPEGGFLEPPKMLKNIHNLCKLKTFIQEFTSLRRIVGDDRIYIQDYMSGDFWFSMNKRYPNVFRNDVNNECLLEWLKNQVRQEEDHLMKSPWLVLPRIKFRPTKGQNLFREINLFLEKLKEFTAYTRSPYLRRKMLIRATLQLPSALQYLYKKIKYKQIQTVDEIIIKISNQEAELSKTVTKSRQKRYKKEGKQRLKNYEKSTKYSDSSSDNYNESEFESDALAPSSEKYTSWKRKRKAAERRNSNNEREKKSTMEDEKWRNFKQAENDDYSAEQQNDNKYDKDTTKERDNQAEKNDENVTHESAFLENHGIKKQKRFMNETIQKASLAIIFPQDTPDPSQEANLGIPEIADHLSQNFQNSMDCQDQHGFTTSTAQGLQDTIQDDQDRHFQEADNDFRNILDVSNQFEIHSTQSWDSSNKHLADLNRTTNIGDKELDNKEAAARQ